MFIVQVHTHTHLQSLFNTQDNTDTTAAGDKSS